MEVLYCIIKEPDNERYEFDSTEKNIIAALKHAQDEAEIFVQSIKAKIIYNAKTGELSLVSMDSTGGVTISYSEEAFQSILKPIADGFSFLAKYELLKQLEKLGDKEISELIRKNKRDDMSHAEVDNLLVQIQHHASASTPLFTSSFFKAKLKNKVQHAIYEVLAQVGIPNIKSTHVVAHMMDQIKEKLSAPKIMPTQR